MDRTHAHHHMNNHMILYTMLSIQDSGVQFCISGVSGVRPASSVSSVLSTSQQMLLAVLPHQQSSTDVHIEGADQPQLRDLHALLHQVDQLHWDALTLVAASVRVWGRPLCYQLMESRLNLCYYGETDGNSS